MGREVLQQPETSLTELTLKRFLSGVDAQVLCEVTGVVELLSTLLTDVGFLSGVDQLVPLQSCSLGKALAALGAAVRFLCCLLALVSSQLGELVKLLPTQGAAWRFLLMSRLVRLQPRRMGEAFPALVALVWFLPRVDALVDGAVLHQSEALAAV